MQEMQNVGGWQRAFEGKLKNTAKCCEYSVTTRLSTDNCNLVDFGGRILHIKCTFIKEN